MQEESIFRQGMKLVWRSMKLHPVPHTWAILGSISFAISIVAMSRAIGWVTDEVIIPGFSDEGVTDRRLLSAFLVILFISLFRGIGAIVRRYYLAMADYRTEGTWRGQLFDQYLRQPLSFHKSTPTGQLIAHTDNDLVVAGIMLKPLGLTIAALLLAVLAVVSLTLVHPFFGLIALVVLPILAVINKRYSQLVSEPSAEVQEAVGKVSGVAHESFDGIMVVKTLGRSDAEVGRMRDAGEVLRSKRLQVGRVRAVYEPLLETIPNVGVVLILLVGAVLVDSDSVSVGEVVGAMSLFSVLSLPIRLTGFFLQSMPPSVKALQRLDKVIQLPLPDDASTAASVSPLPDGALELAFNDVSFAHQDNVVLDGIDLTIEPGETVALVGATGSGKTTLLEIASGLIDADVGGVSIGGVDYDGLKPSAIAERVVMVFQETFLFAETIRENIVLGSDFSDSEIEEVSRAARAHDFILEQPDRYETVVGERGITLSGGQRQRVALARALLRRPSVLLLDDATSAVDATIEGEILAGLRESKTTLLMVAHRLSSILLADKVAYLDESGTIAGFGKHAELLSIEGYRSIVQAYEEQDETPVDDELGRVLR